jgi:hypothetical protein
MKKDLKTAPLAILLLSLLTLSLLAPSAAMANRGASRRKPITVAMAIPPQPSLDDAVMLVQAQSSGRILSAREVLYEGYFVYEIKVMRNGRVEIIRVRSSTSN